MAAFRGESLLRRSPSFPGVPKKLEKARAIEGTRIPVWILDRYVRRPLKFGLAQPEILEFRPCLERCGEVEQHHPRRSAQDLRDRREQVRGLRRIEADGVRQKDRVGFGVRRIEA